MSVKQACALLAFCLLLVSVPSRSYANNTTDKENAALSQTIETEYLSGINLWIAKIYNGDRALYAVIVTLVMAALGTTLAFFTDLVLKAFGLEVSKISHRE